MEDPVTPKVRMEEDKVPEPKDLQVKALSNKCDSFKEVDTIKEVENPKIEEATDSPNSGDK